MITRPTVLVLGAGASIPYGLPSGQTLLEDIVRLPRRIQDIECIALAVEVSTSDVEDFIQRLKNTWPISLDAYLENRNPRQVRIGRACIAAVLVRRERIETLELSHLADLRRRGSERDADALWYHLLWHALYTRDIDLFKSQFGKEGLAIVTFNYDRTLETFLYNRIKYNFEDEIDEVDAFAILNGIPIIHLHGSLQPFMPEGLDGEGRRLGYDRFDWVLIKHCANGIRIIHEVDAAEDPLFVEARSYLSNAARVGIMGFGYHEENVRRLSYRDARQRQFVFAATYRMGAERRRRSQALIQKYWATRKRDQWQFLSIKEETDCVALIENYDVL